jgi:AraC-like DNA-binding protein
MINKSYYHSRSIETPSGSHSVHTQIHQNNSRSNILKIWKRYTGCLVLEGTGNYIDENGVQYPVQAGSFIQHIPHKYHHLERGVMGWLELAFGFNSELYDQFYALGLIQNDIGVINMQNNSELIASLEELKQAIQDQDTTGPNIMTQLSHCLSSVQSQIQLNRPADPLEIARKQLRLDYRCKIDLQEMSRELQMSYVSFRSKFKNRFGTSPALLRKESRLSQALLLLSTSRISIEDLCSSLGYQDRFSFSKEFKKSHGISPIRYQKEHQF